MTDQPPSGRDGRIVTFYSYKGGTGRTMTLANVAWILAAAGNKVLMIDWDLEAPGLHRFFHPYLDPEKIKAKSGVVNMIDSYCQAAKKRLETARARAAKAAPAASGARGEAFRPAEASIWDEPGPGVAPWWSAYAGLGENAVPVNWRFDHDGSLDFVSASRQGSVFSTGLSGVEWETFYTELHGAQLLSEMRRQLKAAYDYVLIDSRTGKSDIETICTKDLPDDLVVCFTLSDQNIEGTAELARHAEQLRRNNPGRTRLRILPVVTRVDDAENNRMQVGLAVARNRFSQFVLALSDVDPADYWGKARIPYKALYSYEELLAVFGDEPNDQGSVLAACERVTGLLTDGRVAKLAPMSESVRRRNLDLYLRPRPAEPADIYISSLPADESWTAWLRWLLGGLGYGVVVDEPGAEEVSPATVARRMGSVECTLAVVSTAYQNSPQAEAVRRSHKETDPAQAGRLIALLVDEPGFTPAYRYRRQVDVSDRDEAETVTTILRALGLTELTAEQALEKAAAGRRSRFPRSATDVWQVPPRGMAFIGRDQTLEQVRLQFQTASRQALHGLGGVGKTALALEYAWRHQHDYDVVWWIRAEQRNIANEDLAALGKHLGIRSQDNIAQTADATREALRLGVPYSRWLLVFDNAKDPAALLPLLPETDIGHILITTQDPVWARTAASSIQVEVFTRAESVEFLKRRVPRLSAAEADLVAETLGDLPLAVELAAAWLQESGMAVPEYVSQLATELAATLYPGEHEAYERSVFATWHVTSPKINSLAPAAARLLQLLSFFGPEPIAADLVYSDAMVTALLPYDPRVRQKMMIGRHIQELVRFALVQVHDGAGNAVQVHRLVQQIVRESIPEEAERHLLREQIHAVLAWARPAQGDVDNPEAWDWYGTIWPHVFPSRVISGSGEVRQLYVDRVRYLRIRGDLDAAMTLARETNKVWNENADIGPNDEQNLSIRFELACALRAQGNVEEALEIDTEVRDLQLAHRAIGPGHIAPLITAGGLGADYRALGLYRDALELDRQTYASFVEGFGSNHARTLIAANNLAVSLRAVGDFGAALDLDRRTHQLRIQSLGPNHHYTFASAIALARDLRDCGDRRQSLELLTGTYEKALEALGEKNPRVHEAAKALAISLRKEARRDESADVIAWLAEQLGPPEDVTAAPDFGYALNAAADRAAHDDATGALDLAASVLAKYAQALPARHPDALVCANNVGVYLRKTNRSEEAHALLSRTLDDLSETLDESHLLTLGCAINVANTLADLDRREEADALYAQTVTRLRAILAVPAVVPDEHPDVLACEGNRAVNRYEMGHVEEATAERDRIVAAMSHLRDPGHPNITALGRWQRIDRELDAVPW